MIRNIIFYLSLFVLLCGQAAASSDHEIALFNSKGEPVAYIAVDDDYTIYLWGGKPVAYLYRHSNNIHIYSFNGDHLGWFEDGIIRDHDGNAVGFKKDTVKKPTQLEPLKGLRELKPLKSLRELPPLKPLFTSRWSKIPLEVYLTFGKCEPAILVKDFDGDKIIILRLNDEAWVLEAKTWCSWSWKYEGKIVWIKFSYTTTEVMNDDGDISEFWTEREIHY